MLKDEGVGVHLLHELTRIEPPAGKEVVLIDSGTSSDVASAIETADKLIVLDAINAGGKPGTVYRFNLDDINIGHESGISAHDISLLYEIKLQQAIKNRKIDTVIIGVEPKEIDWGLELSPEIKNSLSMVKELVMEEIRR